MSECVCARARARVRAVQVYVASTALGACGQAPTLDSRTRCMLRLAGLMLRVACLMLRVACLVLHVSCRVLHAECSPLHAASLHAACYTPRSHVTPGSVARRTFVSPFRLISSEALSRTYL